MIRPLFTLLALVIFPVAARADAFDNYTNPLLAKVPAAAGVEKVTSLTPAQLTEHLGALPGIDSAFLVVKTNGGRWCKILAVAAQQKLEKKTLPIFLIERYVTYRNGDERTIDAEGKNVRLFAGFVFNLDLGQVVPANVGGDLRFVVKDGAASVEPVGKAELYLVTKHLPEAIPKKLGKLTVGPNFEPKYFNGVFKLYDDGRRTGLLHLKVEEKKPAPPEDPQEKPAPPLYEISGWYYSDKDGQKYEVTGTLGTPPHLISFKITFPRSSQSFHGWMFTGDGQAITGMSRLANRETGFYALRVEEK